MIAASQREDVILGRAGERRAALGHLAVGEREVERAAADAVTRLEHDHGTAGLGDRAGGGEAREPGSDHDDVGTLGGVVSGAGRAGE